MKTRKNGGRDEDKRKKKVKVSRYTPWRRMGEEEV
jgi:hypothetical protein